VIVNIENGDKTQYLQQNFNSSKTFAGDTWILVVMVTSCHTTAAALPVQVRTNLATRWGRTDSSTTRTGVLTASCTAATAT
jgi:hypothetical protein